ncbi:hypothetical protein KQX54_003589 [Cotesia glomerata]|uniref:Uncharacterized protein n=2 Tax=Cotesia glomerata TaxID=32391 RepID=A0AAV7I1Q4_COTGL|nr:hypothetical protein KQX54_003589 [Cotesia glomerata]
MKVPKKYPTDGRRDPQDTEYYCQISAKHQPRTYKKRYIYYYDYAKRYKKSDPDIAFIGLNESIIFNSTKKISVPIARPCHEIDYDSCLITQLKDRDRGHFEYKCKVTFEDKEINDGFMEQSYQKQFGKLDCSPKTSEQTTYYGGNPIVCRLKKSDPKKYVQIGILQLDGSDYKYIYLPDIVNL